MREIVTVLLPLLFYSTLSIAQKPNFLFAKNNTPAQPTANALYYDLKPVKLDKKKFEVKKLYSGTNSPYLKAFSKDKNGKVLNGYATYYYKNGKKKEEGNYINGKEAGLWTYYSENGFKTCEGKKVKGLSDGLWKFYFRNSEQLSKLAQYKNDEYHGELTAYHKNGFIRRYEVYNHGKLSSGDCYTRTGQDTVYYPDHSQIRFPGGNEFFDEYVLKNTRFRGYWKKRGIKEKICIRAFFDEKGKVSKAVFEKQIDSIADAEAMRIIMNMPNWEPAEDEQGKRTKSEKSLELMF